MSHKPDRVAFRVDRTQERFLLEPGQTNREYHKLKTAWDLKLSATGFVDIEHVSKSGKVSPFFSDYPTYALGTKYSEATLDYFLLAATFRDRFNFKSFAPSRQNKVYKFMWTLHAEGLGYQEISTALVKRTKRMGNKKRMHYGKPNHGLSIYFVHTALKKMEIEFLRYVRETPTWFHTADSDGKAFEINVAPTTAANNNDFSDVL